MFICTTQLTLLTLYPISIKMFSCRCHLQWRFEYFSGCCCGRGTAGSCLPKTRICELPGRKYSHISPVVCYWPTNYDRLLHKRSSLVLCGGRPGKFIWNWQHWARVDPMRKLTKLVVGLDNMNQCQVKNDQNGFGGKTVISPYALHLAIIHLSTAQFYLQQCVSGTGAWLTQCLKSNDNTIKWPNE